MDSFVCNHEKRQKSTFKKWNLYFIGYNAEKLPLGKLSKSTILKAST